MNIVKAYPPNIEDIRKFLAPSPYAVFTYGDTIYTPIVTSELSLDLIAHEEIHCKQQGNDPRGWWIEYLSNPQFRLEEEIMAYRRQWQIIKGSPDQYMRFHLIAKDLSSPMYGSIITYEEARKMLK